MAKSSEEDNPVHIPSFDHEDGFLWPAAYHILRSIPVWPLGKIWPVSKLVSKSTSTLAVDIYIMAWWAIELFLLLVCGLKYSWSGWCGWVLVGFVAVRFLDLLWVLLAMLLTGSWNDDATWASRERVLLLTILNAIEIMVIFAALYKVLGVLVSEIADTSPPLNDFLEAFYFSVVTGTTLGYGSPAPAGWLSMLLVVVQTCTIVLVVVVLIGYVVGHIKEPPLSDQNGTEQKANQDGKCPVCGGDVPKAKP